MPDYNTSNPWLEQYIQVRQDCYFDWSYDKTFSRKCTDDILPVNQLDFQSDPWCIFAFNTMLSLLKGMCVLNLSVILNILTPAVRNRLCAHHSVQQCSGGRTGLCLYQIQFDCHRCIRIPVRVLSTALQGAVVAE